MFYQLYASDISLFLPVPPPQKKKDNSNGLALINHSVYLLAHFIFIWPSLSLKLFSSFSSKKPILNCQPKRQLSALYLSLCERLKCLCLSSAQTTKRAIASSLRIELPIELPNKRELTNCCSRNKNVSHTQSKSTKS